MRESGKRERQKVQNVSIGIHFLPSRLFCVLLLRRSIYNDMDHRHPGTTTTTTRCRRSLSSPTTLRQPNPPASVSPSSFGVSRRRQKLLRTTTIIERSSSKGEAKVCVYVVRRRPNRRPKNNNNTTTTTTTTTTTQGGGGRSRRRRRDVNVVVFATAGSSMMTMALGANFLGVTSLVLSKNFEGFARDARLDVVYAVNGYRREVNEEKGYEFLFPNEYWRTKRSRRGRRGDSLNR